MGTPTAYIRPRAIYLLRRDADVLLMDWHDEFTGEPVWLAPGGSIDHGETALAAAHRELHEEIGIAGVELRHLATFENIFEYGGATGHEVCFVFEGAAPPAISALDEVPGVESDGLAMRLLWVPPRDLALAIKPLWPAPLMPYLTQT
jgi:8-oxo-dGTP pyrophosphatase MutT (NUDIX family)